MRRVLVLLLVPVALAGCTSRSEAPPAGATAAGWSTAVGSSDAVASSPAASRSTQATPPRKSGGGALRLEAVGDFESPIYVTAPKGDHKLYVVEQAGVVRIVSAGKTLPTPFLDISGDVRAGGEQGLLSIAFSPAYAQDGHVYVDYTDNEGDTRVVEFTRKPGTDVVDPQSRRELLKVGQPFANHNGGLLIFDSSGMLLVGLGDGGSGGDPGNRGQDLGELLGKILRIDPRPVGEQPYTIPADNPFVGKAGVRPEIWAYGLRNPWRFSFDADGTFFVGDVGQNAFEEINVVAPDTAAGANYGWNVFEGKERFREGEPTPGGELIVPALIYGHDGGRCSVTGGGVYAGSVAALRGRYLYADYCSGEVWAATLRGTSLAEPEKLFDVPAAASFGVDDSGEMYVVSIARGTVHRIAD